MYDYEHTYTMGSKKRQKQGRCCITMVLNPECSLGHIWAHLIRHTKKVDRTDHPWIVRDLTNSGLFRTSRNAIIEPLKKAPQNRIPDWKEIMTFFLEASVMEIWCSKKIRKVFTKIMKMEEKENTSLVFEIQRHFWALCSFLMWFLGIHRKLENDTRNVRCEFMQKVI